MVWGRVRGGFGVGFLWQGRRQLEGTKALTIVFKQLKAIFEWYNAWFLSEDFNGCMFQKALEEVIKIYPSTLEPATQYKIWLTALVQRLLTQLGIQNPTHLATLIVSILDGMTIQAHVNRHSVEMDQYWTRVEHLINYEKALA